VYAWVSVGKCTSVQHLKNLTHHADCIKEPNKSVWQRYNYVVPNIQSDVCTYAIQSITVNS